LFSYISTKGNGPVPVCVKFQSMLQVPPRVTGSKVKGTFPNSCYLAMWLVKFYVQTALNNILRVI